MATPRSELQLTPLPDALTGPLEKLVFLYIRQADGATVYELRDALDEPQLRLYPIIDGLADRGLVERHGDAVEPADSAIR